MEYRELGRTGVKIYRLCLGTMTFGEQNTEAEGHAQMDHAFEQGINVFDASEVWTAHQILQTARSQNGDPRLSAQALARALHALGALPLGQHHVTRNAFESFWALRNPADWKRKSGATIVRAWRKAFPHEIP